jgi:hypothetical protein
MLPFLGGEGFGSRTLPAEAGAKKTAYTIPEGPVVRQIMYILKSIESFDN